MRQHTQTRHDLPYCTQLRGMHARRYWCVGTALRSAVRVAESERPAQLEPVVVLAGEGGLP